jgi:hypothetical protein
MLLLLLLLLLAGGLVWTSWMQPAALPRSWQCTGEAGSMPHVLGAGHGACAVQQLRAAPLQVQHWPYLSLSNAV